MYKLLFPVITLLIFMVHCGSIKMMQKAKLPKFDIEAHRGGRGLMPENTISAMLHSVDLGVSTLELDVHISGDKQVIVAHDSHINSKFSLHDYKEIDKKAAEGFVFYNMPYSEIRKFDVGSRFHEDFPRQQKQAAQIPLLAALIDSVQQHIKATGKQQVFYNIETKSVPNGDNKVHPEPEEFVSLVMEVVKQKDILPWLIIQSFDPRTLEQVHAHYPNVRTSLLTSSGSLEDNLKKLSFKPTIYSPNMKLVTSELVKDSHKLGLKVIPWTVNDEQEISRLKLLGVDGIITDYPNLTSKN